MNRIRFYNNTFQVLITPHTLNSASFETLIDNWLDSSFNNFFVVSYPSLLLAQNEAMKHPDIDWYKLHIIHMDNFKIIRDKVEKLLMMKSLIVDFKPRLSTPEEIKNAMFDRVLNNEGNFSLTYNFNDIININIINPWYKNIIFIANLLKSQKDLNIINVNVDNYGLIELTGRTDIGTTYQIKLWTTIIYNCFANFNNNKNNNLPNKNFNYNYQKSIELQKTIDDNNFYIR